LHKEDLRAANSLVSDIVRTNAPGFISEFGLQGVSCNVEEPRGIKYSQVLTMSLPMTVKGKTLMKEELGRRDGPPPAWDIVNSCAGDGISLLLTDKKATHKHALPEERKWELTVTSYDKTIPTNVVEGAAKLMERVWAKQKALSKPE